MIKINYEIFEKWWEYFLVIFWGFSHPNNFRLMNRSNVKKHDLINEYQQKIAEVLDTNDLERIKYLTDFIDNKYESEEERKRTIENKAHSLIGQTSIAVSFLLAAISIGTSQYDFLPIYLKIIVWILFFLIIINFVTAGLHARNAVTVLHGYAHHAIESFFIQDNYKTNILVEKYFMSEYNSYLNDVKATYLRFSHWYFKFSFIITVLIALLLPPMIMLVSNSSVKPDKQNVIENIIVNRNYINHYGVYDSTKLKSDTTKLKNTHNKKINRTL